MVEYDLEIRDGISFPLSDIEEVDERRLGADERAQIREMSAVNGPSTVEYGGDSPWTHQWIGTLRLNDIPDYMVAEDDEFEDVVTDVVETLLSFFGNGSTPNNTTADDFEWRVQVNKNSPNIRPDGVHTILISWEPV